MSALGRAALALPITSADTDPPSRRWPRTARCAHLAAEARQALPSPDRVLAGAAATALLVRLRWRQVRGWRARAVLAAAALSLLAVLFLVSNVGYLVRRSAESADTSVLSTAASTYLATLQSGGIGDIGAIALGSAVAASLLGPLTGAGSQALAAGADLAALRPPRLHRYFDAVLTTAASTIGLLQLLSLTAVASLLTLDGGRVGGLLLTWAVWVSLLLTSVAEGWTVELLHRTLGARVRVSLLVLMAAVLGVAVLVDPQHGRTLFGLGQVYADALRSSATGPGAVLTALAGLGAFIVVVAVVGLMACEAALRRPAALAVRGGPKRQWLRTRVHLSHRPSLAVVQILLLQVLRTGEARRPLLTILGLGVPSAWLAGVLPTTAPTLVIAIPLTLTLAWGANAFGVLGPAMPWLASQPRFMGMVLWSGAAVQVGLTALIAALCWLPPTLLGHLPWGQGATLALATAAVSATTTRAALSAAVHRPHLARLGSRGDSLLPPVAALHYTLRFTIWAMALASLVLVLGDHRAQAVAAGTAVTLSAVRFAYLARRWSDRTEQARVVAVVAPA